MKKPQPRTTKIIKSNKIKGLFYEGFKKDNRKEFNDDDLVIAFHYNNKIFDLHEIVQIKPDAEMEEPEFKEIVGQPLLGIIVNIEPDSESGEDNLVIRVDDCESEEQELFMVTEIAKKED